MGAIRLIKAVARIFGIEGKSNQNQRWTTKTQRASKPKPSDQTDRNNKSKTDPKRRGDPNRKTNNRPKRTKRGSLKKPPN